MPTISVTSYTDTGITLTSATTVTIAPAGTINIAGTIGYAVSGYSVYNTVINAGLLEGGGTGVSISAATDSTVYNLSSGSINSTWGVQQTSQQTAELTNAGSIYASNIGIDVSAAVSTIVNVSGGQIENWYAEQGTVVEQYATYGVIINEAGATIVTSGTMTLASHSYARGENSAVSQTLYKSGQITNAGLLSGGRIGVSVRPAYVSGGGSLFVTSTISNLTGGIINGFNGIEDFAAYGTIINQVGATISGNDGVGIITAPGVGYISTYSGAGYINSYSGAGYINSYKTFSPQSVIENAGLVKGYLYGVSLMNYGTIENAATGTITSTTTLLHQGVGVDGAHLGGSVDNAGLIAGSTIGVLLQSPLYGGIGGAFLGVGVVENSGTISGKTAVYLNDLYAATLVVDPGAVFSGAVKAHSVTTGAQLDLNSGSSAGILNAGSSFSGFADINFAAGSSWTLESSKSLLTTAKGITGFGNADTIEVQGFNASSESFANNKLTLTGTSGTITLNIDEANATKSDFTLTSAGGNTTLTTDIPCFCAGTRIGTPDGEVAVEDLRAGDLVLTATGALPVRWIGQSHVSLRFADPLRALPVRIAADALGNGLPLRDLLVSPDHALFVAGLLVQAGALAGRPGISREHNAAETFTYYHVELDSHALLYAEGALAESFVDNIERMAFHNWNDRTAPATPIVEMPYPRVKSARQLPLALRIALAA